VPGVDVAQIDANVWAISIRGFNGQFANKVLVLIDGRTVYTPIFSGVYWDQQSVQLPDIDRIEVIRGPGGTVWGANAVNGVINIITKDVRSTSGGLLSLGTGSAETARGLSATGAPSVKWAPIAYLAITSTLARRFSPTERGPPTAGTRRTRDSARTGTCRLGIRSPYKAIGFRPRRPDAEHRVCQRAALAKNLQ